VSPRLKAAVISSRLSEPELFPGFNESIPLNTLILFRAEKVIYIKDLRLFTCRDTGASGDYSGTVVHEVGSIWRIFRTIEAGTREIAV
jgi:hypothetical protein